MASPKSIIARNRVAIVGVLLAMFVIMAVVMTLLTLFIDSKLNQSAEQQVLTFTEQAAYNVSDRTDMLQAAIGAFTVQSGDPEAVRPALSAFKDRFGFTRVAFAAMNGKGLRANDTDFSVDELPFPDTALSQGKASYSPTFVNEYGERVRLAQQPLFVDGKQVGALYVQVPFDLVAMRDELDMFNGRGYFILFDAESGEVLVTPGEATRTPIECGDSIYDFLTDAGQTHSGSFDPDTAARDLELLLQMGTRDGGLDQLRYLASRGASGVVSAFVDGRACFVAIAPVRNGTWYACNVVPMENVRAESTVVTTTFQVVFGIVCACLIVVGLLAFLSYSRRVRESTGSMMSELYGALSESVDLAVNLYCPGDGTVTPISPKAEAIIGYPFREFIGQRDLAANTGYSPEGVALINRIRSGSIAYRERGEFSLINPHTEQPVWVNYAVTPLEYDGKPQVLVVMQDATTEKLTQLSMKDAMDAAESANRAKSEFLSRMSHDIRTPMNGIIGMLQIARRSLGDDEKMKSCLTKIDMASNQLLGLINDVLDFSKIESGNMTLASERFRLSDIVSNVAGVIRVQCDQRAQTFEVATELDGYDEFLGDSVRLTQLLTNLLSNATKYTYRDGTIRFTTTVSSAQISGYRQVEFVVADNGIGMSEEYLEHLFEPFSMEGRSAAQGTGLGMSIVKNIVTMMGGVITVDSKEGEGTTFHVVVNLRLATSLASATPNRDELVDPTELSPDATTSGTSDATPGEGKGVTPATAEPDAPAVPEPDTIGSEPDRPVHLMVVEDNELNAEIASELLAGVGFEVSLAYDGAEALEAFKKSELFEVDAILMDVQMPNMNGYEATAAIRALDRPDARNVPIIAMSANAFSEDVTESIASGMDAHLSKPINVNLVRTTVLDFVSRRHL